MAQVSAASGVGEVSAEVDQVLVQGDAESVPQIPKERLVFLLCQEIVEGIRKVGEYRRMSHELKHSVRRYGVSIAELKALGDCGFWDGSMCLRFLGAFTVGSMYGKGYCLA
ncbi:hypothetical protein Tco_0581088 [Tanacetum coccineum]